MESGDHDIPVIGQQMADAIGREASHRAAWSGGGSPLDGVRYDWTRGEADLLRIRDAQADAQVRDFLESTSKVSIAGVADVRGALTIDDFYTLITFAQRSAVHALRGEPSKHLGPAFTAIALVDAARVDPRDVAWAESIAAWSVQRVGLDHTDLLRDAERVGTPDTVAAMSEAVASQIDLSDWGFEEVATSSGTGLAERGFAAYAPTADLLGAALALADVIEADRYMPPTVTVASDLPAVWFRNVGNRHLDRSLRAVQATVSIGTQLRPAEAPDPERQRLLAFVSECEKPRVAAWLGTAGQKTAGDSHHVAVSTHGRWFAVLIARSIYQGTPSFETDASLQRFLPDLTDALRGLDQEHRA